LLTALLQPTANNNRPSVANIPKSQFFQEQFSYWKTRASLTLLRPRC
jgi:hypothetical protein